MHLHLKTCLRFPPDQERALAYFFFFFHARGQGDSFSAEGAKVSSAINARRHQLSTSTASPLAAHPGGIPTWGMHGRWAPAAADKGQGTDPAPATRGLKCPKGQVSWVKKSLHDFQRAPGNQVTQILSVIDMHRHSACSGIKCKIKHILS